VRKPKKGSFSQGSGKELLLLMAAAKKGFSQAVLSENENSLTSFSLILSLGNENVRIENVNPLKFF
jgi:hypothetical protein